MYSTRIKHWGLLSSRSAFVTKTATATVMQLSENNKTTEKSKNS